MTMGSRGRILYVTPDARTPAGGVKAIYAHVALLSGSGFPAFVLHGESGFTPPWLPSACVPTLYVNDGLQVVPDDVIVIPEDFVGAFEAFRETRVRKVVFCQSYVYVFTGLNGRQRWEEVGVTDVFCSSEIVRDFLQLVFGYGHVPVVHNAVDMERFRPRAKKLQIAFMPRKRPAEVDFIRETFDRLWRGSEAGSVDWVPIDGVDEDAVARLLGESQVFLSTGLYESFGLPALEAMASGCIVVGFHGHGGRAYAHAENGVWCQDGDLVGCAQALHRTVSLVREDETALARIQAAALATAKQWYRARQKRELLAFWRRTLERHAHGS